MGFTQDESWGTDSEGTGAPEQPKPAEAPELLIEVGPMPEKVAELAPGLLIEVSPTPEKVVELAPGLLVEVDNEKG